MIDDRIREFTKEIASLVCNETEKFMFQFGGELAREKGEEGIRDYLGEIEDLKDDIAGMENDIDRLEDERNSLKIQVEDLDIELKNAQRKLREINALSA